MADTSIILLGILIVAVLVLLGLNIYKFILDKQTITELALDTTDVNTKIAQLVVGMNKIATIDTNLSKFVTDSISYYDKNNEAIAAINKLIADLQSSSFTRKDMEKIIDAVNAQVKEINKGTFRGYFSLTDTADQVTDAITGIQTQMAQYTQKYLIDSKEMSTYIKGLINSVTDPQFAAAVSANAGLKTQYDTLNTNLTGLQTKYDSMKVMSDSMRDQLLNISGKLNSTITMLNTYLTRLGSVSTLPSISYIMPGFISLTKAQCDKYGGTWTPPNGCLPPSPNTTAAAIAKCKTQNSYWFAAGNPPSCDPNKFPDGSPKQIVSQQSCEAGGRFWNTSGSTPFCDMGKDVFGKPLCPAGGEFNPASLPTGLSSDYCYYSMLDSTGNDLSTVSSGILDAITACDNNTNCVGTNTDGNLKNKLIDYRSWNKWTTDPTKGFYMKTTARPTISWRPIIPAYKSPTFTPTDAATCAQYGGLFIPPVMGWGGGIITPSKCIMMDPNTVPSLKCLSQKSYWYAAGNPPYCDTSKTPPGSFKDTIEQIECEGAGRFWDITGDSPYCNLNKDVFGNALA